MLHQQVQLGFRLDRRRHVVMIADRHPFTRTPVGEIADLAAVSGDFGFAEGWLGGKRRRFDALDRTRGLAIDDARRARGLEESELRGDPVFLDLDVAVEQQS